MPGPLSGLRVLDLSRVLAGPWAGQTLADLGAEVIKVERPGIGDDTRTWGPPFAEGPEGTKEAAYFLSANRGKESVAIDITTEPGQRLVRALAERSDVLIENFKVGGLAKYGLDYDTLKSINPRLVYCSITGFGQDGPYAHRPGYDFMVQGMSGLMSITGEPDDRTGGGPMKVGVAVSDVFTGLYATIGILAALRERDVTGEGQRLDMALLDCQMAVLANQALNCLISGEAPKRLGNAHPNIVPYQAFATADGHMILAVGNDGQFRRFCEVAGCQELAGDDRFATNPARVNNREELIEHLSSVIRQRRSDDWLTELEAAGIPCGSINSISEAFEDPQVVHRGLVRHVSHAAVGRVPTVRCPIRSSSEAVVLDRPVPSLGEHTRSVLANVLGMGEDEIARLRRSGAIG